MTRSSRFGSLVAAGALLAGCLSPDDSGPVGPPGGAVTGLLVLNSVGQTMRAYQVRQEILGGVGIDLGALFDGEAVDVTELLAVSTASSFGGDQAYVVDLVTGETFTFRFVEPSGDPVNPSKPFVSTELEAALIGGRGTNSIYQLDLNPAADPAVLFAPDAGEFVEKVVVANGRVFAVDSNIDDVEFTFEPLGVSRVRVFDLDGNPVDDLPMPDGSFQATNAVLSDGRIVVLNAGTLTPTFEPEGNGNLAIIDPATLQVSGPFLLGGNGVSLEDGADGRVYVTVTSDFVEIRTLSFEPATASFVRGPDDPILTRDASGAEISCWVTTAVADGRLVCATFRTDQAGRLFLLDAEGSFISSTEGGFGTTDLEIVPTQQ